MKKKAKSNSYYKYKSLTNIEFLLDMLIRERLYAAYYNELNDPMEGVIRADHTIDRQNEAEWENIIKNFRIACFTNSPDITLMWSHYADGAKGCVVEFEIKDDIPVHKVSYLKRPQVSKSQLNEETALNILTYKEKPWKYEQESRVIIKNQQFIPIKVKKVVFGHRAPEETVKMLTHILTLCKPEIDVCAKNELRLVQPKIEVEIRKRRSFMRITDDPSICAKCYDAESLQKSMVYCLPSDTDNKHFDSSIPLHGPFSFFNIATTGEDN